MTQGRTRISWFGLVLILIGLLLLFDRLRIVRIESQIILWSGLILLGFISVMRGFSDNRPGRVFWGTFIFLFALFFLLRSMDLMDIHAHMLPPALFLMVGISFLMLFLHTPKEWGLLIPAVAFGALGVVLIMVEYGYLYEWDVWDFIRTWWPLILILLGVSVVLRPRPRRDTQQITS